MKLFDYGFTLENYCMSIKDNKIFTLNFSEYKNEKVTHQANIVARKDGTYQRKDFLISEPDGVPERFDSIQPTASILPLKFFDQNADIQKLTYQTAPDKTTNSFFIHLPFDGKLIRKLEVSKDATAFYNKSIYMIQIYHENEDGELNFEGEHDTIHVYTNLLVADYHNDGSLTRMVSRCGEKEEYYLSCSLSPIHSEFCSEIFTKDNRYQVKYNFSGMLTEVASYEDRFRNELFSRYEMIDEKDYHVAHSIYPYLGGLRASLHSFPFREIWVHDEANLNNGVVETLNRTLFVIRDEEKLLHDLRSEGMRPIIDPED